MLTFCLPQNKMTNQAFLVYSRLTITLDYLHGKAKSVKEIFVRQWTSKWHLVLWLFGLLLASQINSKTSKEYLHDAIPFPSIGSVSLYSKPQHYMCTYLVVITSSPTYFFFLTTLSSFQGVSGGAWTHFSVAHTYFGSMIL